MYIYMKAKKITLTYWTTTFCTRFLVNDQENEEEVKKTERERKQIKNKEKMIVRDSPKFYTVD